MRRRHAILLPAAILLTAGGCTRWCPGGSSGCKHEHSVVHHHHVLEHHHVLGPRQAPQDRGDRHSREDSARTASDRGSRYGDSSNNDSAARQRTRD